MLTGAAYGGASTESRRLRHARWPLVLTSLDLSPSARAQGSAAAAALLGSPGLGRSPVPPSSLGWGTLTGPMLSPVLASSTCTTTAPKPASPSLTSARYPPSETTHAGEDESENEDAVATLGKGSDSPRQEASHRGTRQRHCAPPKEDARPRRSSFRSDRSKARPTAAGRCQAPTRPKTGEQRNTPHEPHHGASLGHQGW